MSKYRQLWVREDDFRVLMEDDQRGEFTDVTEKLASLFRNVEIESLRQERDSLVRINKAHVDEIMMLRSGKQGAPYSLDANNSWTRQNNSFKRVISDA